MDNFATDEEETWCNKYVTLQKGAKNTVPTTCEYRESFKENWRKKNHTSTQNETIDISGAPEERGLSGFDTQRTYWRQEENSE